MMRAGSQMARKSKKKTSRPKDRALSVTKVAEAAIVGNAASKLFFDVGAVDFLTKGWFDKGVKGSGVTKSGAYGSSWELTLYELVNNVGGSFGGNAQSFENVGGLVGMVKRNVKANFGEVATIVLTPVLFKGVKKIARSPIRMANRGLKMLGLRSMFKI